MTSRSQLLTLNVALLLLGLAPSLRASDHFDAPLLDALSGKGDVDINDVYAFQSPTNPSNTVLIMTVNPFAGQVSGTTFNTGALYEFQIDNDGDALPDVTYSASFSAGSQAGSQGILVSRNNSNYGFGDTETDITTSSGGALRAGLFDDPFFFDLVGFQNSFSFTGDDAFAGANVSAIVLEVPSSELVSSGGPNIGVWARTWMTGSQVDRAGRPAINTVLIPSARKNEFNQTDPDQDPASFGADVQAAIEGLNGSDATHASAVTGVLLPDVLTFDTSSSAGFLNGRQLADDVIDAELTLLTNSPTPVTDGVDANDVAFLNVFPYLAPANTIVPEPSGMLLLSIGISILGSRRRRPKLV